MENEDKVAKLGKKRNQLLDGLSTEKKADIWKWWHGESLIKTLKEFDKGVSLVEALALASGDIVMSGDVFEINDDFASNLAANAYEEQDAYDLAMKVCAVNIAGNGYLQEPLRILAIGTLAGIGGRPKKPGRRKSKNWNRNVLILRAVLAAPQYNIPITSSGGSDNICAIKLVTDTFKAAGHHMVTENVVRHVWKKRRTSGLEEEIRRLDFAEAQSQFDPENDDW